MNKTILIVDDEASIRRLSKRILERSDYATLEAGTGAEGLQQLESADAGTVSAVLLDLNLPDGSGGDWAVKYRALQADLPIIYFTGAHPESAGDQHNPLNHFLKKPFTPASIQDVIASATAG